DPGEFGRERVHRVQRARQTRHILEIEEARLRSAVRLAVLADLHAQPAQPRLRLDVGDDNGVDRQAGPKAHVDREVVRSDDDAGRGEERLEMRLDFNKRRGRRYWTSNLRRQRDGGDRQRVYGRERGSHGPKLLWQLAAAPTILLPGAGTVVVPEEG